MTVFRFHLVDRLSDALLDLGHLELGTVTPTVSLSLLYHFLNCKFVTRVRVLPAAGEELLDIEFQFGYLALVDSNHCLLALLINEGIDVYKLSTHCVLESLRVPDKGIHSLSKHLLIGLGLVLLDRSMHFLSQLLDLLEPFLLSIYSFIK